MINDSVLNNILYHLTNIENKYKKICEENLTDRTSLNNSLINFIEFIEPLESCENAKKTIIKNIETIIAVSNIDEFVYDSWLMVSRNFFISFVFPHLDKLKSLSDETIEKIKNFAQNTPDKNNFRALMYYILSSICSKKDPFSSYKYGIDAFRISNDIASTFGLNYIYDANLLKENVSNICPICNSDNTTHYKIIEQFKIKDLPLNFSPYKLWYKCNNCTNLFAYNFPISDMSVINGHYTSKEDTLCENIRFPLQIYSNIFNNCKELTKGNKYLEIGIGNGEMLACAMEMNYDVTAIEICKQDSEKVSRMLDVDIINDDFLNIQLDKKFDIIIMGDVLEHVSKPKEAISKAKALLNNNGVLWISTPNYKSAFSRLYKDKDPMWNQKNHFTYFSYDGLNKILDELELVVKRYDISNRYNGSMELYIQCK